MKLLSNNLLDAYNTLIDSSDHLKIMSAIFWVSLYIYIYIYIYINFLFCFKNVQIKGKVNLHVTVIYTHKLTHTHTYVHKHKRKTVQCLCPTSINFTVVMRLKYFADQIQWQRHMQDLKRYLRWNSRQFLTSY